MSKKRFTIEHRKSPRYNPEPEDAEQALFFKNEITIRFPCDSVEREVMDLSKTGLKVFLEDNDPLMEQIGNKVKALMTLNKETISVQVIPVHLTEDDYGLGYLGCRFENLSDKNRNIILKYLETRAK